MSTVTKASVYSRTEDTPDTPSLASIDRFLDAVWMERGLSPNTLSAYRADLTALDRWLQTRGSSSLAAKRADVLAFIAYRVEAGHRLRVMVTGADFQNAWPTGERGQHTVHRGDANASQVTVPLVVAGTQPFAEPEQ